MKKQPFVSIIIVNYNGKKLIGECLDSLFHTHYPKDRFEIIVVDNHSSDNSVKFIKANYKKVNIIENELNNYCQACNRGMRKAKGEFICLLNNDVKVKKDWLGELIKVMQRNNAIGAVTGKILKEDGTIQNAGLYELPNFYWGERGAGKENKKYNTITEIDAVSGTCVLYRRKALEQAGLLDEDFVMFGEDVDMSFRLKKKRWKLVYVPKSIVCHKFHGSCNEKFARDLIERNRLLFVAKHHPFKLADALLGSGYFIINDSNKNSGRLFDFMPDIFMKLSKEHGQRVIKKVVRNLFEELKRIINYENKKLEEDLKNILLDLAETRKDRDHYRNNENRYIQDIQKQKEITDNYKKEVTNLSNNFKKNLDTISLKDSTIREMEQKLNNYQREVNTVNTKLRENLETLSHKDNTIRDIEHQLNVHRQEVNNLNNKLEESLDNSLHKDSIVLEKEHQLQELTQQLNTITQELNNHKEEVSNLSSKLKVGLDDSLNKDSIIMDKEHHIEELSQNLNSLQNELQAHKQEVSNLSDKLKESLDAGWLKDNTILDKERRIEELSKELGSLQQDLTSYKEEVSNLSDKLKESLDNSLVKDNAILDKEHHIEELSQNLNSLQNELQAHKQEVSNLSHRLRESLDRHLELEKELSGVYDSEGFRFVLNPLWKIIWHSRLILKFFIKKIYNFIWRAIIIFIFPFILLQTLLFLLERLAEILFGRISAYFKKERCIVPFEKLTISVVIPNWNGIDLLKSCLRSLYEIDEFKEGKHEVLVVDDASEYNIANCIKDEFAHVRVIRNLYNKGFGRSCNRGVKSAKGELIILLNNDIMVSKDFLQPLREHFKDENVFAVAPKLYRWDKKTFNYGMHMGRFENGYLSLWNEAETGNGDKVSQASPTIFAMGGAAVFRKRDFLWLGGFDDIYRPNCWEDIDISYRAQKRGLKVVYEPKTIVYHKGASTLNYVRHKEIKNELLFMWKNLTDKQMLLSHLNQLPRFFYQGRHSSRLTFLIGYLWAFDHLIWALAHRFNEKKYIKFSDRKILNKSMLYYRNFRHNNYVHTDKKTILLITPFIIYPLTSGGKLRIYNLYKRLSQKYNLILLSLIHNENERGYVDKLKKIFTQVHVIHPKTASNEFLFPRCYRYSFSSFFIEKLKEILETIPIDIVHIESNELLYLTKYIQYNPIVYTEHDISILSHDNSYYNHKKNSGNPLSSFVDYLRIVRYHNAAYNRIDKVIVLSKNDYMTVSAFAPYADISLIPTGVDLGHFTFAQKTGKNKTLIFVGHYPHYPNEEAAVYFATRIFPMIKNEIPEVRLKLVGSDPTEAIIKLSQIGGIEITGTVEDVNPYFQDASIFVNAFQRSAGIKGKVLEAMATGTPVVCTTRGACGIDAIDGQSALIADRPVDFANYVVELLKDNELYRRIAFNARKLVEQKYDWHKIAKQLDRVYQDIMGLGGLDSNEQIEKPQGAINELKNIIDRVDNIIGLSLDYLNKNGKSLNRENPEELHIELTHLCNSKCITCDIWDYHQRNNRAISDELSFEEIKSLIEKSEHLKAVKTVVLSGGEPFLRPDLVDICCLIGDVLPQASLGILTNATNTESVLSKTKAILETSRVHSLWIGSSLDGIGQMYDKIRGMPGGFERFVRTVVRFKQELPDISFSITFVLTPFNIEELLPCWEFADKFGLDFFAQFGVPKQARSPEVFQWQEKDYARIEEYATQIIEKIITKNTDLEHFRDSLATVNDKINILTKIYYWAHLVDFQRTGKRLSYNCNAGFKFAMFDAYGNMFFCPLLKDKTIGNIRGRDFDELWSSQEAGNIRGFIDSGKCSCWLVCTVFPIVSQALSLYGDQSVASVWSEHDSGKAKIKLQGEIRQALTMHMDKVDNFIDRKDLLSSVTANIKSNTELNDAEFKDKKYILQSTPQGITIGTNYGCNADCIFCLGGEYKPFSLDLYKNYFEPRLGLMLTRSDYVSLCGTGELLLVPEVEKILDYLSEKLPDKNKILTTNGLALNNKICERIVKSKYSLQISLHASNPSLHEYLTGIKGGFDIIVQQIKALVAKRRDRESPYITLVFVINTMNIEDLPNFVELAVSLGADCVQCNYLTIFKPSHIKLSCFFKQEITNQMLDVATQKAKELKISLMLPPRFLATQYFRSVCSDPWKNVYVDTEGAVLPCCYSGEHFGELEKEDIFSIWNNAKFKRIRADLSSGNPVEMCKYCLNNKQDNVNLFNAHISFRPEVQKTIFEQN